MKRSDLIDVLNLASSSFHEERADPWRIDVSDEVM